MGGPRANDPADLQVFGVVGDNGTLAREFLANAGFARVLIDRPHIKVLCSGMPDFEGESEVRWGSTNPNEARGLANDWFSTAEVRGAAGVIVGENGEFCLFTDSFGLNPVYHRQVSNSLFFSNRIAPLVRIGPLLTPDWLAWACTFVTGSPFGSGTHFEQVQRLEGATCLKNDRGGGWLLAKFEPRWLSYPTTPPNHQDLLDVLSAALPPTPFLGRPPAIPLSGGWDSRLLAALASRRYRRRPHTWTTAEDDGRDLDIQLAPRVASALRLPNRMVHQPSNGWPKMAQAARARMEHETWMHTWLLPLGRAMRSSEWEEINGLGGDILVRGLFGASPDPGSSDEVEDGFYRMSQRGPERFVGGFRREVAEFMYGVSRDAFLAIAARFLGHRNRYAVTNLHARTTRTIALAATRVIGPEVRPWFPFLSPEFVSQVLAYGPALKVDGKLMRTLLALAAPKVAVLPSTNDPGAKPPRSKHRLQASAEAVDWMVGLITESDAASSLFESSARRSMADGSFTSPHFDFNAIRVLQASSLLAEWEIKHRHRLTTTIPSWG